eukprot:Awhi_evm1s15673
MSLSKVTLHRVNFYGNLDDIIENKVKNLSGLTNIAELFQLLRDDKTIIGIEMPSHRLTTEGVEFTLENGDSNDNNDNNTIDNIINNNSNHNTNDYKSSAKEKSLYQLDTLYINCSPFSTPALNCLFSTDVNTITQLHLCHSELGDEGAECIASSLGTNVMALSHLCLTNDDIGERGGK